jgi:predicted transcriptional regulator/GNAT superfamily N-acetyltransferase
MAVRGNCIILSIRREHAQRIFEGSKTFELRKSLPKQPFQRVYLYETAGRGIVGCFDVARVLREEKNVLWNTVRYWATTKARFDNYFDRFTDGYAIEVSRPVKFKNPISSKELREIDPKFHVPMSSVLLRLASPLGQHLERQRRLSRKSQSFEVQLAPIVSTDRERYKALVLKHIGARYEGIDATFASRTLNVHDLGHDPSGFFTERKDVFSIWNRKQRIGFTTITWKNTGCAKTGPTIIESESQGRGYGRATRRAIEAMARAAGCRKVYCTFADNATEIISYLLDSEMKIEAHLDRQYSAEHGELVFGKFLIADEYQGTRAMKRSARKGELLDLRRVNRSLLKTSLVSLFSGAWTSVDEAFADRILKSAAGTGKPDPRNKSKRLVCVGTPDEIVGLTVLLPKRGGAVKALLCASTNDPETLRLMITEVCRLSCGWGSRKIYFLHPLLDGVVVKILRESQFQMEGFLRAPYRPGEDVGIFSRFC